MSRDLTRERQQHRNGPVTHEAETAALVDEVLGSEPAPHEEPAPERAEEAPRTEVLKARRDWVLARVALMLIDAAKLLDPITRILVARCLAFLALAAATGIAFYAIQLTEGWERVAVAGIFTCLAALLIRKGQS